MIFFELFFKKKQILEYIFWELSNFFYNKKQNSTRIHWGRLYRFQFKKRKKIFLFFC